MSDNEPIITVLGPTATGKTGVALNLKARYFTACFEESNRSHQALTAEISTLV